MRQLLVGYVTSAGAGSASILQVSRSAFVLFMEKLVSLELQGLLFDILMILRENGDGRNERLISPTIAFIAYLFESGSIFLCMKDIFGPK